MHLKQDEEEQQQIPKQFSTNFPAVDLPTKNYSLDADMVNGWRPKQIKLLGPVPFNFDSRVVDDIIDELTSFGRKHKERVIYLGNRYGSSFKMHQQMPHQYRFKYQSMLSGSFVSMAAYFRKFHANFKSKNAACRLFRGMNPTIKQGDQIEFNSQFQSGNLDTVVKVSENQYDLFMRVDTNTRGHVQWFNFTVKNHDRKKIKLNIVNFKKYKTLYSREMKPYMLSEYLQQSKGLGWHQSGQNVKYEKKKLRYGFLEQYYMEQTITYNCLSFEYTFETDWETVQFAYCPPFTYSQTLNMINKFKKEISEIILSEDQHYLKEQVLCESLGGLDIPLLTITDPQIDDKHKKCILVSARIHPGETCGSHMMTGFLKFVCSNSEVAKHLRKQVVFKVIPMLNPDGVVVGNFRTALCGKDLNRQFRSSDILIPEVKALKQLVLKLKGQFRSRLIFFMDFHGHSVKKNVFLYGSQYEIWENNYYRTRVFPKLLSLKTQIFRYYSCLFRIADFKRTTARAVVLNNIPHCYTVQASTGFYYSSQEKKDIPFTPQLWQFMGKTVGEGVKQYIDLMYDSQISKQQKRQKLNDLKTGKVKCKTKNEKSNLNSGNKNVSFQTRILSVSSTHKHKSAGKDGQFQYQGISDKAKSMIQQLKMQQKIRKQNIGDEQDKHQSDQYSEGGSDSQGESDDIPEDQLANLHKQIIDSMKDFKNNFYGKSNQRQLSFKDTKKKPKQQKNTVRLKPNRQSKGIQMIASLRKKADQMEKMKDVFVWPKFREDTKCFTGSISKQNQSSPDYHTKVNFRTYLEHINKDRKVGRKQYSKKQQIFSSHSHHNQEAPKQFQDYIFGP